MFASAKSFTRNLVGAAGTLVFGGLCIAGATTPANAQIAYSVNDSGHRVAYVSYKDLDLASQAGRSTLDGRLRIASKHVCQGNGATRWEPAEEYKCFHETYKASRTATMAAIEADKVAG
ncbi:UrcA family protein [Sandarakinorhabdus oryzae]|uniref:UrcA family protein n=1 Tax=Sandarakinorhabdus oryzae TaxID=2675220 RepID=UPI0018CC4156|nr:UrcA family protein [Sandarakinorhabdus oryzae]